MNPKKKYRKWYQEPTVFTKGWFALADFLGMRERDLVSFEVTPRGFKMTVFDRDTSCEKLFFCPEHGGVN